MKKLLLLLLVAAVPVHAQTVGQLNPGAPVSDADLYLTVQGGVPVRETALQMKTYFGGSYSLPIASASVLGGVKQGANVTIGMDGTISVAGPVTSLPFTSITSPPTTLGGYGITDAVTQRGSLTGNLSLAGNHLSIASGDSAIWVGNNAAYNSDANNQAMLQGNAGNNFGFFPNGTALYFGSTSTPFVNTTGLIGNGSQITLVAAAHVTGLATVATSGSYADLGSKPTIPTVASTTSILKGNGSGGAVAATAGTDYVAYATSLLGDVTGTAGATVVSNISHATNFPSALATTNFTASTYAPISGSTNYDTNGAASTVQTASLQKSSNLSDVANPATSRSNLGAAGLTTNAFNAQQNAPAFANATGPANGVVCVAGDSRTTGSGSLGPWSQRNGAGLMGGYPASLQNSGFCYGMQVFNWGISGQGIETGIFQYSNCGAGGAVTTTGNITAGSSSITITGTTTGLTGTMYIGGPGIPYGATATISGTTVTVTSQLGGIFTPILTTTGATITFSLTFNKFMSSPIGNFGSPHQLSPAVNTATFTCTVVSGSNLITLNSGVWTLPTGSTITSTHFPGGTATVLGSGTTMAIISTTASGSGSTEAVTVVPFAIYVNAYGINDLQSTTTASVACTNGQSSFTIAVGGEVPVVGYTFTGTGWTAGTTITGVSYSGTTSTYTTSNSFTGTTGNITITITPNGAALLARTQYLNNLALADGYKVVTATVFKAWVNPWYGGDAFRVAFNTALVSYYGGGAVSNVYLCDLAANPVWSYPDPRVYSDLLHPTQWGYDILASDLNSTLTSSFPSLMTGPPLAIDKNQSVPVERINSTGQLNLQAPNGGTAPFTLTGTSGHVDVSYGANVVSYYDTNKQILYTGGYDVQDARKNGVTSTFSHIPLIPDSQTTVVNGSTSGSATFAEPFYEPGFKIVAVKLSALVGTASWTYLTAFTSTPVEMDNLGLATTISATAVTVTGATSTGTVILGGY